MDTDTRDARDAPPEHRGEIRRYPNRKLYATGGYVTLSEIAQMLRDGTHVTVRDTRTGRDMTAYTLAQVIVQEVEAGAVYDAAVLRTAIVAAPVVPEHSDLHQAATKMKAAR